MPQSASLGNGVWLEIQIADATGEVSSAPANSNGLRDHLEVAWRHSWRTADVRVTQDIVQGTRLVSFATTNPTSWVESFLRVKYGLNRKSSVSLSVASQTGQAVFDCATVEVFDIWRRQWVPTASGLQLTLQIT